jgi:hypothetical protein
VIWPDKYDPKTSAIYPLNESPEAHEDPNHLAATRAVLALSMAGPGGAAVMQFNSTNLRQQHICVFSLQRTLVDYGTQRRFAALHKSDAMRATADMPQTA